MKDNEPADQKRIQRKRTKGWRMPENTVYVGRGSKYGNPFRVEKIPGGKWAVNTSVKDAVQVLTSYGHIEYKEKGMAVNDAIRCFEIYISPYRHGRPLTQFYAAAGELELIISELKGKNLACWCKDGDTCHADVLLKLANEPE